MYCKSAAFQNYHKIPYKQSLLVERQEEQDNGKGRKMISMAVVRQGWEDEKYVMRNPLIRCRRV